MWIKPSFRSRPTWAMARSATRTGISRAPASSSAWLAPGSSASLCPGGRHESRRPPTRGTAWPGPAALLLRLLDQPAAAQRLHSRGIQGHVQAALGFPREEAGPQARRSSRAEHRRRQRARVSRRSRTHTPQLRAKSKRAVGGHPILFSLRDRIRSTFAPDRPAHPGNPEQAVRAPSRWLPAARPGSGIARRPGSIDPRGASRSRAADAHVQHGRSCLGARRSQSRRSPPRRRRVSSYSWERAQRPHGPALA